MKRTHYTVFNHATGKYYIPKSLLYTRAAARLKDGQTVTPQRIQLEKHSLYGDIQRGDVDMMTAGIILEANARLTTKTNLRQRTEAGKRLTVTIPMSKLFELNKLAKDIGKAAPEIAYELLTACAGVDAPDYYKALSSLSGARKTVPNFFINSNQNQIA